MKKAVDVIKAASKRGSAKRAGEHLELAMLEARTKAALRSADALELLGLKAERVVGLLGAIDTRLELAGKARNAAGSLEERIRMLEADRDGLLASVHSHCLEKDALKAELENFKAAPTKRVDSGDPAGNGKRLASIAAGMKDLAAELEDVTGKESQSEQDVRIALAGRLKELLK